MAQTRSVPTSPSKRRRVLSEITHTDNTAPEPARRKSLGFDMARIDLTSPNAAPECPALRLRFPELATRTLRGSSIPVLKKSDRLQRLLSINESLNRKCKIDTDTAPPQDEDPYGIQALLLEARQQADEIRTKRSMLNDLEEERLEVRQLNKALLNEIGELKTLIDELGGKFEYLLGRVTAKVETKERDINLDLRNYKNKLEDERNDAKFELENEMLSAKQYEDSDLLDEVRQLKEKKLALEQELATATTAREEFLKTENALMDEEMNAVLAKKSAEVEGSTTTYQNLQNEFQFVVAQLDSANEELRSKQSSNEVLQQKIYNLEANFHDFEATKRTLHDELSILNRELSEIESENRHWSEETKEAKALYDFHTEKYGNYHATRRILEHGIAKYERRNRTLVRVDHGDTVNNEVTVGTTPYQFDKVVSCTDRDFSLEWRLFVTDAVLESDAALILLGSQTPDVAQRSARIFSFLKAGEQSHTKKGWSFSYYLQSVRFSGRNVLDELNGPTETSIEAKNDKLEVKSQQMIVQSESELRLALKSKEHDCASCQIYTILGENPNGQKSERRLFIVDLALLSLHNQNAVLSGTEAQLNDLVRFIRERMRHMKVCDVDVAAPGAAELFSALQKYQ